MTTDLTSHELKVLQMLADDNARKWSEVEIASLDYLAWKGLCSRGSPYQITVAGASVLAQALAAHEGPTRG